jgi:hypothetical protein
MPNHSTNMVPIILNENNGNMEYSEEDLNRSSRFLSFYYRVLAKTEDVGHVSISKSQDFTGNDECHLKKSNKKVSFLLNGNMHDDIRYFESKYINEIEQIQVDLEDYELEKIELLMTRPFVFGFDFSIKKSSTYSSPLEYWRNVIEKIKPTDLLNLWIKTNSFYRQIMQKTDIKIAPYIPYLEVFLMGLSASGNPHLSYDGGVMTRDRFLIPENIFKVKDPDFKPRSVKAYSFIKDLRQAILFNPALNFRLMKSYPENGNIKLEAMTDNLFQLNILK